MTQRILLSSVGLTLIVVTGLVHGSLTNRWTTNARLAEWSSGLKQVPLRIGRWEGQDRAMDAREVKVAGAQGALSRVYVDAGRGLSVVVMALVGPPSGISSHSPTVCYPGAGFVTTQPETLKRTYGDTEREAMLNTTLAVKQGTNPSALRIYWTWSNGEGWSVPTDPRWSYAAAPALCKLYLVRETGGSGVAADEDPSLEFLDVFLPELEKALTAE